MMIELNNPLTNFHKAIMLKQLLNRLTTYLEKYIISDCQMSSKKTIDWLSAFLRLLLSARVRVKITNKIKTHNFRYCRYSARSH